MSHRKPIAGHDRARHTKTRFIWLNTHLCQACWGCIEACPNGVIGKIELPFGLHRHARIDHAEQCQGCKKCVHVCPTGAIVYTYVSPNEQKEPVQN
ncbi:MAG: ferredoxin family protein [Chloroflexota bacterium]